MFAIKAYLLNKSVYISRSILAANMGEGPVGVGSFPKKFIACDVSENEKKV